MTLLIVRENGIDDQTVGGTVEALRSRADTAVFVTPAAGIAKYSRITQGVDVERTPALVVVRPRRLTEGPTPVATVSYGFRGPQSVDQAVDDALYAGATDIPYYPSSAGLGLRSGSRLRALSMDTEAFEHYLGDARRRGEPLAGGFDGAAGGAPCGDLVRISLALERAARIDARQLRRRGLRGGARRRRRGRRARRGRDRARGGADRPRRGRRASSAGSAPQGRHARRARRRRAAPRARRRGRLAARAAPRRRPPASGSWSRSAAASTPPSPRCSSASAGRRSSR